MLCHVRQHIFDVHQCLLGGPESFPYELTDIVEALNAEHVPAAWIHPNCQPSTHSLTSWQQGRTFLYY